MKRLVFKEKGQIKKSVPFLLFAFLVSGVVFASEEPSNWKVASDVNQRGVVNFVTAPYELVRTTKEEYNLRPRAWFYTAIPRSIQNMTTRMSSATYDMLVKPWGLALGKSQDTSPLTEHLDLPEYAWSKEEFF